MSVAATTLAGEGISIDLPPGWEGAIYRRQSEVGEEPHPVVHAATFPLPVDRGRLLLAAVRSVLVTAA